MDAHAHECMWNFSADKLPGRSASPKLRASSHRNPAIKANVAHECEFIRASDLKSQAELFFSRRTFRVCGLGARLEPIFASQMRKSFCDFGAITFRRIARFRIPLLITSGQAREFLLEKREELFPGSGHQEEHARREPACVRIACGTRQQFEIFLTVGKSWQDRHNQDSRGNSRLPQHSN